MADEREVFSMLEDTDGSGAAPSKKSEGDVALASVAVPGLIAKDSSGNLKFLTLDADGKLPVSTETPGTCFNQNGTVISVKDTDVDVATITGLTISKAHTLVFALGSSTQPVYWKVVQTNDATETTILDFVTGSGQYSFQASDLSLDFTTGASGTQSIRVIGKQMNRGKVSDLHATIKILEKAA